MRNSPADPPPYFAVRRAEGFKKDGTLKRNARSEKKKTAMCQNWLNARKDRPGVVPHTHIHTHTHTQTHAHTHTPAPRAEMFSRTEMMLTWRVVTVLARSCRPLEPVLANSHTHSHIHTHTHTHTHIRTRTHIRTHTVSLALVLSLSSCCCRLAVVPVAVPVMNTL
jgi:hypothetical protein